MGGGGGGGGGGAVKLSAINSIQPMKKTHKTKSLKFSS